jgi:hypothetical protein
MTNYTYRRGQYYLKQKSACGTILVVFFIVGCGLICALLQNIGIMMDNFVKKQQLNKCSTLCSTVFHSVEYNYSPEQLTKCSTVCYNKYYKK